jgi:long-chain acyl-CoA synthetase
MFGARYASAVVLTLLTISVAGAAEVAGVRIEDRIRIGSQDLVLNGAGLRTRMFFKVYVAALYLPRKTAAAAAILDSQELRRVGLHLLRDLDADALVGALKDGLRQNHTDAELAALRAEIDQFETLMRGIGNGRAGDLITLDLTADGTTVGFKGQERGKVSGNDLGRALLKVWLGEKPVEAGLKQALLGN